MPVYMLFIREGVIRDKAEMETYSRMNRESPRDPKLKALVAYGATEAVEGTAPDGMVMLEFPTAEDAKAWYNNPHYQAALPHRLKGADYRAFIVQGL
jgi:uncharacterized protein (DUF1330 family)